MEHDRAILFPTKAEDMYCSGWNFNETPPLSFAGPGYLAARCASLSQVRPSVGPDMTEKRPESYGIVGLSSRDLMLQFQTSP
jgi:hypothetical protein